jgi:membrane fusion protein (multidrug efflux system)
MSSTQSATNDVGLLRREIESESAFDLKATDQKKSFLQDIWLNKKKRKFLLIPLLLLTALIGRWIVSEFTTESTDDAFVTGHVHIVGARIAGTVIDVPANDNQAVKKGDVLIKLDPKDFEVALKIAEANSVKAHVNLKKWGDGNLHPNEMVQKNIDAATVAAMDASLEQAKLNLQYTEVRAFEDGKIGNRAVETGQQVAPAQALMALVEPIPWVIANYKEHQAAVIRPGQRAEISVDAIPEKTFTGHVDSIAPGSGATFSLLPPDNATGNFTKIVQRIPVKVVFDADSIKGYEDRLTAGMSVSVTIHH